MKKLYVCFEETVWILCSKTFGFSPIDWVVIDKSVESTSKINQKSKNIFKNSVQLFLVTKPRYWDIEPKLCNGPIFNGEPWSSISDKDIERPVPH